MSKLTPHEILNRRRTETFGKLRAIAKQKTEKGGITLAYVSVGSKLKITSQTVYNYVQGKGKDGYMAEALIKEFEKL